MINLFWVWIFSGDIFAAFDETDLFIAEGGMIAAGAHPALVASVLEESRQSCIAIFYVFSDFVCPWFTTTPPTRSYPP